MHHATLYVQPVGAAPIGFAQAAGMPGDIRIDFKTQANLPYPNIASEYPQLVLRPFHSLSNAPYDIVIDDVTGSSGLATIPGPIMNDRFHVEVYTRNAIGTPQRMIAAGRVDLTGNAYRQVGPLAPATYPTGPSGPAGPMGPVGPQGPQGSTWYTGPGSPSIGPGGLVNGDMWLDETSGDVWRWSAASLTWLRG